MMDLYILSAVTGATTLLGAGSVLMFGEPGRRILAFYLGLSSGLMILLVTADLLPAAFAQGPFQAVGMGMGLGILLMILIHLLLQRTGGGRAVAVQPRAQELRRIGTLLAFAVSFHNLPEGIAIGAGFDTHYRLGLVMALAIAIHNIPEGISMALPFAAARVRRRWILLISLAVSLCIPAGAWLGHRLFIGSPFDVALGLGFASGAMGYIVFKEIGPVSLKYSALWAQLGMAASIGLMYFINLLG